MGEAQTAPWRWGETWPYGNGLAGHVYQITDALAFFEPILIPGQGEPQGYEPWAGLEVRTWSVNDLLPSRFPGSAQTGSPHLEAVERQGRDRRHRGRSVHRVPAPPVLRPVAPAGQRAPAFPRSATGAGLGSA